MNSECRRWRYQIDEEPYLFLAVESDEDEGSLQGVEYDERIPQSRQTGQGSHKTESPRQSHHQRQFDVQREAQLVLLRIAALAGHRALFSFVLNTRSLVRLVLVQRELSRFSLLCYGVDSQDEEDDILEQKQRHRQGKEETQSAAVGDPAKVGSVSRCIVRQQRK